MDGVLSDKVALKSYLMSIPYGEWGPVDVSMARGVLGYTQEDLANAVGYSRQGIGKIESEGPTRVFELAVRFLLKLDNDRIPTKNLRVQFSESDAIFLSSNAVPVLMVEPTGSVATIAWVMDRSGVPHFTTPGPGGQRSAAETREELIDLVAADGTVHRTRAFVVVPSWL
jgi:DNA-binding XRE family transcriptional regulator